MLNKTVLGWDSYLTIVEIPKGVVAHRMAMRQMYCLAARVCLKQGSENLVLVVLLHIEAKDLTVLRLAEARFALD